MNRCDIGSDGKTPLQRQHGRRDNTTILALGERILHMPAKPARGGKWEPRFHPGVFVGMLISSSEATPWSPDGSDNAFDMQVGMERDPPRWCPETQEKC